MFSSTLQAGGGWAVTLAVIAAVNSVIAFFYYAGVIRAMWFHESASEERSPIRIPPALGGALAITVAVTVVVGIYPQLFARVGDLAF
jgi:NADH-quinone oxidoreductase subunit N